MLKGKEFRGRLSRGFSAANRGKQRKKVRLLCLSAGCDGKQLKKATLRQGILRGPGDVGVAVSVRRKTYQ